MDSTGAWRGNALVKREWRSVKYEVVYLKTHESISHARRSISSYRTLHNQKRPHPSLTDQTPDEACFAMLKTIKPAAPSPSRLT